jgi:hypothetical protein
MARVSDDSRNDSTRNESRGAFDDTADSDRILSPVNSPALALSLSPLLHPNPFMPLPALLVLDSRLPIHDTSTTIFVS